MICSKLFIAGCNKIFNNFVISNSNISNMRSKLLTVNTLINSKYFTPPPPPQLSVKRLLCDSSSTMTTIQSSSQMSKINIQMEEVRIPVPWGHIAGKWWGPKTIRPIIGIHGWQDNAGTFDTLIPLLPQHLSYLSLDLPGHGLSSRIPDGMYYNTFDCLHILNLICKEYGWEKISLMGHSMSSILSFLYGSSFPDKCDLIIGLDALKPHVRKPKQIVDTLTKRTHNFLIADIRNRENSEPPSYTYDELIEKLTSATFNSITKETAPHLLERAIKKSQTYPEKYYFSRDSRLKCFNYATVSQEVCLEMAGRITMPYLFIKANNSPYYEDKKYFDECIEVMKKHNPKFELHFVDGTHHNHLTDPQLVSGLISEFIMRQRPIESVLNSKL